jgi:hypothetical protein
MLLITAKIDYADEFDCEMFAVMSKTDWDDYVETVSGYLTELERNFEKENEWDSISVEVGFGTNEAIVFTGRDDWFDSFTVTEITQEEAKFLTKNFGKNFGTGSSGVFEDLYDVAANPDEDNDY